MRATEERPHRLLLRAQLRPRQGSRFRPTGFPDVGAAEFTTTRGATHLLVESVQSTANRLESAIWDVNAKDVVEPLCGMPYVRHCHPNYGLVTSLTEPHRLASPYLWKLVEPILQQKLGRKTKGEWDRQRLAGALLQIDPNSLLHGVFLVHLKPPARITRALSGFIEAKDVSTVLSGGVKLDSHDASGAAAQGKGNIPYALSEYISEDIHAYFNLDLLLLEAYGLSEAVLDFLVDLALYKIRRFIDRGLRLRSACDFEALDLVATHPADYIVPEEPLLAQRLRTAILELKNSGELEPPLQL